MGENGVGIRVRPVREGEVEALSELAMRSKAVWGYGAEFLQRCRPLLRVTGECISANVVYAADVDGRIAGFYSIAPRGEVARPDYLFVEPEFLRQGIGSVVLAHALDQARELGMTKVLVESDPEAEGFYVRAGGARVGAVQSTVEKGRMLPVVEFELGGGH